VFKKSLHKINRTDPGKEWLTKKQLEELYTEISEGTGDRPVASKSLHEANKAIFNLLLKNTTVDRNELTAEQSPVVRFIDFDNWDNNSFIAINQFRIQTPGGWKNS